MQRTVQMIKTTILRLVNARAGRVETNLVLVTFRKILIEPWIAGPYLRPVRIDDGQNDRHNKELRMVA